MEKFIRKLVKMNADKKLLLTILFRGSLSKGCEQVVSLENGLLPLMGKE